MRGDTFFFFQADHAAGLQRDLDRLRLEHALSAKQPDKSLFSVDHWIHRVVPVEHQLHRVHQRHRRLQRERIAEHDVAQRRRIVAEQEIAHRHEAEKLLVALEHVDVGDEGGLHQLAQLVDRLAHRLLRRIARDHRLHHAADAVLGIGGVRLPLPRELGACRGEGALACLRRQRGQDVLRQVRREPAQRPRDRSAAEVLELCRRRSGRVAFDVVGNIGNQLFAECRVQRRHVLLPP